MLSKEDYDNFRSFLHKYEKFYNKDMIKFIKEILKVQIV